MKKTLFGVVVAAALALSGCRSVSTLSFDVWRPAKVTFSPELAGIVVVNNSADTQGASSGEYVGLNGESQSLKIVCDSLAYHLSEYLAVDLDAARYFQNIALFYDDSIALPRGVYPLLSEEQLRSIRGGADGMAVISLDQADLGVKIADQTLPGEFGETLFVAELAVGLDTRWRAYSPGSLLPETQSVNDTLYWYAYGYTPDEAHHSLPPLVDCVDEALRNHASRAAQLFVPHVDHVSRYIFTSANPVLSDAYDFWGQKKYTEASYLWEYAYEEEKRVKTRAMAAANLGVYHELLDRYDEAVEWIDRALLLFEKAGGEEDCVAMLRDYHRQLEIRQRDDAVLQKQL